MIGPSSGLIGWSSCSKGKFYVTGVGCAKVLALVMTGLTQAGQGYTAGRMWPTGRTLPRSGLALAQTKRESAV